MRALALLFLVTAGCSVSPVASTDPLAEPRLVDAIDALVNLDVSGGHNGAQGADDVYAY